MYLFTENGNKYLDIAAGYAANSFGHCHPKLVEALKKQADKMWHISNRFEIPGMNEYAKRLVENTFADTIYIANTGAEAVETALKMTRRYFKFKGQPHRYRIITLEGAFHGRTLACASAGSVEKIIGFEPPVDGFDRVPFNDIEALKAVINDKTAGVLIEPIQGEGGMRAHSEGYMKELRKICDAHGALLLLDEIQCGAGRTGWLLASEMYGVKPDLVMMAKGIGGGFPVSICLATEEVGQAMEMYSHGSTFGGNPLAIAVATQVLDMLLANGFLDQVKKISSYLLSMLSDLKAKHQEHIEEIRGNGLMLGIKLKSHLEVAKVVDELRDNYKVLSIPASQNVIRITPALIIEKSHCDEAVNKLGKLFDNV
jgi:acetylornithine/N-succinyldiaminopimelate aminotransferase